MRKKLIITCLAGLTLCSYFLFLTEYVGVCLSHCDPVNYSLGVAWFSIGILLGILPTQKNLSILWAIIGILGVLYFVTREFFEGFCPYCTLLHVITVAGAILALSPRGVSMTENKPKIYTIGYEKRSLESIIQILKEHDITTLVDVRKNPYSRRKEFCKENLARELKKHGIEYYSFPGLGTPPRLRPLLRKNPALFQQEFLKSLDTIQLELLDRIARKTPTVIMCYERDPFQCHRSILTKLLPFEVIHLGKPIK